MIEHQHISIICWCVCVSQNGSDEPVSEDKERQSELAAGYDQVWGRQPRKRRTLKDTL